MKINWKALLLSLLPPLIAAGLGGFLVHVGKPAYEALIKPGFLPPDGVFSVVWGILFLLMAVSVYILSAESKHVPAIYYLQLVVNVLWTVFFYILNWRLFAFFWLLLLLILALVMLDRFRALRPVAGWLQLPYVIWLVFAACLNLAIYWLNS